MKGIDLTQEQLDAAARFIRGQMLNPAAVGDDHLCSHYFRDLVRLVAWYGAIRYVSGRDGVNSLDNPGPTGEREYPPR